MQNSYIISPGVQLQILNKEHAYPLPSVWTYCNWSRSM